MSPVELKRFDLLSDLTGPDLDVLTHLLEPVRLTAGQQLFREGQEADGLLLLEAGRLRFESARCGELGSVGPGASIGGLSLLVVGPREATAVAEESSHLWRLSRTAFHRFLEDAPRGASRMLASLVTDLSATLRRGLDQIV